MQRALAIASTLKHDLKIVNPSECDDSNALLSALDSIGFSITRLANAILISPPSKEKALYKLNFNESGLGIRMMAPVLALRAQTFILNGEGSLLNRPMDFIEKGLQQLQVNISTQRNKLPIRLVGPMKNGNIEIDGSISSQFLTGLLLALPLLNNTSYVKVDALKSIPYIDMTIDIMEKFGVYVENDNYEVFTINGNQNYALKEYTIEGDWSSASFHLVGAAISGELLIKGIYEHSKQADLRIVEALRKAGVHVEFLNNGVLVKKKELYAFEFDATHCPDLFPALAILAVACQGQSKIKGVHRLLHKESNRSQSILKVLTKLGANIQLEEINDVFLIHGGTLQGGTIDSHNDHRIAMMAAIASLIATQPIEIENPTCVNKSYPNFYKDFLQATKTE